MSGAKTDLLEAAARAFVKALRETPKLSYSFGSEEVGSFYSSGADVLDIVTPLKPRLSPLLGTLKALESAAVEFVEREEAGTDNAHVASLGANWISFLEKQTESTRFTMVGCRYWCGEIEWSEGSKLPIAIWDHHEVRRDRSKWTRHECDWKRAIDFVLGSSLDRGRLVRLLDASKMDAETGEVWLQIAAFGEVRYG